VTAETPIGNSDATVDLVPGQRFNPFRRFAGIYIPEAVCKYRGLSAGAKLIYGRLCRYAGENGSAYPAISSLANEIGIRETQARAYIKELEKKRFIEVDRENRRYRKDGSGGSNFYFFLWHAAFTGALGESQKIPPAVRKTEGVPPRETEPLSPAENRTRRESVSRESLKENHSSDYQPTNRKNRDSHAGNAGCAIDSEPENQNPTPKPASSEKAVRYTKADRELLRDVLGSYGRRRTMRYHMQEEAPSAIVEKCLEAADGNSLRDVVEILRYKCVNRGLDPGTSNGPKGWGWFPTVLANEIRARREQLAASQEPTGKHWSEYEVKPNEEMQRAISTFCTLDDLGATA
jgi:hypothetical protein